MRFDAYSRSGVVAWEFDSASGAPPPPPPPPAARLNFTLPVTGGARAIGYDGFGGSAGPAPSLPTITVRLVDAAVSGGPLPSLTGIQWGWWDSATDLEDTFGVAPTASGTAETTDAAGNIVMTAAGSTKTSGQQAFILLHVPGSNPRTFGALLTVG